ncbi:hypothetical protein PIGHUM_01136 [Pigmentiphaga humi]|uniref:Pilin accessory protein (PilO) n=1 Tax=Pigmentiphaga humi TaxID=2478468 RepID=A0A3P4B0I9_9BURK|nr:type 4b pilus protein PilO2 [Pigmentiphaga humi]VCU69076.1 hypothetical protein PIGHUM_01136 [Pigmentiphaga humi]
MADYLLHRVDGDERMLILGMRWHTILGSRLDRRARKTARQMRATHYAHDGRSEAVGVVRLGRADRRGARLLYSGALAFAAGHRHGVAALRARLPDGRIWVVAVQSGKVLTHSDRLYVSEQDAEQALADLVERYGDGLDVYGPQDGETGDLSALLPADAQACGLRECGWALPALPKPLAVAALGCALALGGRAAWDGYRSRQVAAVPAEPVDAASAWRQSLDRALRNVRVHGSADRARLLAGLAELPAGIGGWRLASASCKRAAAQDWSCAARYDRQARQATNASFLEARPAGWQETWQPMDAVVAHFSLDAGGGPLDPAALRDRTWQDGHALSAVQRILPLLSGAAVGEFAPLRIQAPHDEQGRELERPAGMPALFERALRLEGPLRSLLAVPEELDGQIEWRQVSLTIDDGAAPSLNRSRIMAGISGVLYAHE